MLISDADPNPPKQAALAIGLEARAVQRGAGDAVDTEDGCSKVGFAAEWVDTGEEAGWIEGGTVAW